MQSMIRLNTKPAPERSPTLAPKGIKYIQLSVYEILYYARALDVTMLPSLNYISSQQAEPTANTMNKAKRLLDYTVIHLDAYLRHYESDMTLHVELDTSYIVLNKAIVRIVGQLFLKNMDTLNALINIEYKTLTHVVSSAAEAETGGIFVN